MLLLLEGLALHGIKKTGFHQKSFVSQTVLVEVMVPTVHDSFAALVETILGDRLGSVVVSLWRPTENVHLMIPAAVNSMPPYVALGFCPVQWLVELLVFSFEVFPGVQVDQDVLWATCYASDAIKEFQSTNVLPHRRPSGNSPRATEKHHHIHGVKGL